MTKALGLVASGGFGGLFSLATAAWASPAMVDAPTGAGGLEIAGVGGLVAMLVYLLQASTKERVAEAKEYAELIRAQSESHQAALQAERAEQFAHASALRAAADAHSERLLRFYEGILMNRQGVQVTR